MNFVLFTNCNSLTYKEVACDDYCIKVIDEENHKIENNNTWGSLLIFLISSRMDIVCMIISCIQIKISQRN